METQSSLYHPGLDSILRTSINKAQRSSLTSQHIVSNSTWQESGGMEEDRPFSKQISSVSQILMNTVINESNGLSARIT